MKTSRSLWIGMIASLGLIVLILDAKTAVAGAQEGLSLCLNSILPSLLPFCVLTKLINASLSGKTMVFLRPIGKLCGIPEGAESILLLGFLGGYPVGAQSVNDACKNGTISLYDAARLLGFCSNAGPAFLFGILGGLFPHSGPLWCLLIIHILSAVVVGAILPHKSKSQCSLKHNRGISLTTAIEESIKTMALVCGWVLLFRIVLQFGRRWFLWAFPQSAQVVIAGLLELSNGCILLYTLPSCGLRYILSAGFLSFGGICVAMQTVSVTRNVGKSLYFPGKVMQTCISLVLACVSQYFLFPAAQQCAVPLWLPVCCIVVIAVLSILLRADKKVVAFAH